MREFMQKPFFTSHCDNMLYAVLLVFTAHQQTGKQHLRYVEPKNHDVLMQHSA